MTPVQHFLKGKTLFITGATGFLARGLVEKLVRHARDIERIYLLIRPRGDDPDRQASANERLDREILGSSAFDRLRQELGASFSRAVAQKCRAVAGDLTQERLGIEPALYERLAGEVDIVINSAATVVFDERIDVALELNTLGPRRLVELARACRDAIFVHVSTAYVNGMQPGRIRETLIPQDTSIAEVMGKDSVAGRPYRLETEIEAIRELGARVEAESQGREFRARIRRKLERLNRGKRITKTRVAHQIAGLRGRWVNRRLVQAGLDRARQLGWNDNYTFTKAMGEQLIARERGDLPTVIVRPTIIESSLRDPEPGWLDGLKVADPLISHYGKGRLPDFPGKPGTVLDLIPVDIVVNAIIAVLPQVRASRGIGVYHVATGAENPLTLGDMLRLVRGYFKKNPMRDRSGRPIDVPDWNFPTFKKFRRQARLKYQIPLNTLLMLMEYTPLLPWSPTLKSRATTLETMVDRVLNLTEIYSPYTSLSCVFRTDNTRRLHDSLEGADRDMFSLDVRRIDWREYIQDIHVPGLKRHVLRLPDQVTLPPPVVSPDPPRRAEGA